MEIIANSVSEAIAILESRDQAIDGRESYFQAHDTIENKVYQIFYDDEDGDDTIIWTGRLTGKITPGNSNTVEFFC
jgi:hypothetical protein